MDMYIIVYVLGFLRSALGIFLIYKLLSTAIAPDVPPHRCAKISATIAFYLLFLLCIGGLSMSRELLVVGVIFWCLAIEWGALLLLLPQRIHLLHNNFYIFSFRSMTDIVLLIASLCIFGRDNVVLSSMFAITIFLAVLCFVCICYFLLSMQDISMHRDCYEQEAHVSNSVLFIWFTSVLDVGHSGSLRVSDLPHLPSSCSSVFARDQLQYACFRAAAASTSLSPTRLLLRSLLLCYWREFFVLGVIKLLSVILSFAGPVLLGSIVSFLEESPSQHDLKNGVGIVALLVACFVMSSVLNVQYSIRGNIIQSKMRNALTLGVYSRILSMPMRECITREIGVGMATTLVQVDAAKISDNVMSLHELWSLPCQIIIAFLLLYYQVNIAFLAGVFIIIVMIPLNRLISLRIGSATKSMLQYKDLRLRFLTESLRSIRTIKMSSMESFVMHMSDSYRNKEVTYLSVRKYLDAVCVFLWAAMPLLVPAATFIVTILLHRHLTAAQIFTTIALLNMLIFPMNAYPWIINGLVEAHVSLQRVAKVLCQHESPNSADDEYSCALGNASYITAYSRLFSDAVRNQRIFEPVSHIRFGSVAQIGSLRVEMNSHDNVEIQQLIAGWTKDVCSITNRSTDSSLPHHFMITRTSASAAADDSKLSITSTSRADFIVGPVSLSLPLGNVCAICGPIASGKTTLLLSLLREIFVSEESEVMLPMNRSGGVSYCPQTPVLHSGTIKSNIVFEAPLDESRYETILKGCALDVDFKNSNVSVGQEGNMVSGGQRLRIGVARALYHDNPVVLLDDPFASLDTMTSGHLMQFLVDTAKNEHRAIIIVTHSIQLLQFVDTVVYLDLHNDVAIGPCHTLLESSEAFRQFCQNDLSVVTASTAAAATMADSGTTERTAATEVDEHMERGYINTNIYSSYMKYMGVGLVAVILISTLLMQVASNGLSIWFAYWASHRDIDGTTFITITCIIVSINVVAALLRSFVFALGGLRAASAMYAAVVTSVFNTSIGFFEENMVGRVVNRLGEDTYSIDDELPFILNIAMAQTFIFIGTLVIICYSSTIVIGVLALAGWCYYRLQVYYRYSSRDLRRLDALSRSPVASNLLDSIANSVTIRALKLEAKFEAKMAVALDGVERVTLSTCSASQWLTIRLQLLGIAITGSLAILSVFCTVYDVLPVSPSMFALALSFSFSLVNNVNALVNSYAECEQEFVSVERVLGYINLTDEYDDDASDVDVAEEQSKQCCGLLDNNGVMPQSARHSTSFSYTPLSVHDNLCQPLMSSSPLSTHDYAHLLQVPVSLVLKNVSMRYDDGTLALDDVTLTISAGQRVAIVGRSGSGKSSLFRALLRLNDYTGSIRVDSVELRDIPKKVLRRSIGLVAQDPFLFNGTVRENIDPLYKNTDAEVFRVLQESGAAKSLLGEQPLAATTPTGLLSMELMDGGSSLSYGQRQLLAISRLILQRPQLILLDEATAHVDAGSENIILTALLKNFPTATMLIISHHINRASLLEVCHQVITFSNGKFVNDETQ